MTSIELEQQSQAIYLPILKGLMGHRIFIIRKDEQSIFTLANPLLSERAKELLNDKRLWTKLK
ncbi:MAG: hypothetical protein COB83_01460 [Gammaproteobacteria bacterium]|nr:MAG: hypothetical protein COB83_01460 [Gammaproteobacteria bacterium]